MNTNDLFQIIGETPERYVLDAMMLRENTVSVHKDSPKRVLLIAAIIGAMLLLMGSAMIVMIRMKTKPITTYVDGALQPGDEAISSQLTTEQTEETTIQIYEGEEVFFEDTQEEYLELGPYYPQQIPEGYRMTFVSEGAPLQNQVIHYENEAGDLIKFWIYIGDPASSAQIYGIESKEEISVSGHSGILYKQTGSSRTLVWIDEKLGYGYVLSVSDPAVDILSMAESTAEGEYLIPTRSEETVKAVIELGDYAPEYLPEGFVERATMGSSSINGGWYAYVRKWYVNREENAQIYFEYESYRIVTEDGYTDDARTICSFFIPGYHILKGEVKGTEIEVNDMFGMMTSNHIVWADPETHRVYHLYSKDVTGEELLKVAESISETTP